MRIKLNTAQRCQAMEIARCGIKESFLHMRRIGMIGKDIYSRYGKRITMAMASARRNHCMKLYQQAKAGYLGD